MNLEQQSREILEQMFPEQLLEHLKSIYIEFASEHLGMTKYPKELAVEALDPLGIYLTFPNLTFDEQCLLVSLCWANRSLTLGVNAPRAEMAEHDHVIRTAEQTFMEAKNLVTTAGIPEKLSPLQKKFVADWFKIHFS